MSQTIGNAKVAKNGQTQEKAAAKSEGQENAAAAPRTQGVRWTAVHEELSPNRWTKKVQVKELVGFRAAEVSWMAEGRAPQGALCVVAGEPSSCKSLLAVDWAARVSEGRGERDGVLIAHAGDLPAPILRARLDAAGATVERIAVATLGWPEPGDDGSLAELERRVMTLAHGIQMGRDANMIVIDNLEAWAAGHEETVSRARIKYLLGRLAVIAAETNTAIVALARLNGPAGGRAAARELAELSTIAPVIWLTANDAEDRTRRLLLPIKNSLGQMAPAAAFRIEQGRVAWEPGPLELSATMIASSGAGRVAEQRDREDAAEWLLEALALGPVESGELFRQARSCGISAKTLRRAAKALGLKPAKTAFDGPWAWGEAAERGTRSAECGAEGELQQAEGASASEDGQPQKDGQAEFGIRNAEVGKEGEQELAEGASASEDGQPCEDGQVREERRGASEECVPTRSVGTRSEDGQVRAEKLGAKKETIRERRRRYLGLGNLDERYNFSALPELQSGLAEMAK